MQHLSLGRDGFEPSRDRFEIVVVLQLISADNFPAQEGPAARVKQSPRAILLDVVAAGAPSLSHSLSQTVPYRPESCRSLGTRDMGKVAK